jgi:REP element-mobilizing transposase RayT
MFKTKQRLNEGGKMARTARIKRTDAGTAYYHLMSRTNDKRFLFENGRVKAEIVSALRRAAAFSGIELMALVAMDNHFHVVCKVVRGAGSVPREEIVRRVAILKGEKAAAVLANRWEYLAQTGELDALEAEMNRYRHRMNDISELIKTFKESFDIWFKRERAYCGSLWSGRFASTLIEGGRYLATCIRYVMLNPVRAGLVKRIKDYLWSWAEEQPDAGPVPAGALMRRVAQIGGGTIFGSRSFVSSMTADFALALRTRSPGPHAVGNGAFSSHGWRLAKTAI